MQRAEPEAAAPPRTLSQLPFDVLHDVFEFLEWPAVRTGPARASRRLREAAHAEAFFFRLVRRDVVFAPARKPAAAIAEASPVAADDANVAHRRSEPAPTTKPTNGAAAAAVTETDRGSVPALPTARAFYCKWGTVSAHALVVPVSCPWWCDACRARVERGRGFFFVSDDDDDVADDAAGNACPATRICVDGASLRCVSSSSSSSLGPLGASPPWSTDGTAAAFATEGSVLRPSRPLAPGLVRCFERACDRVVDGGGSEHVVFVDYVAASSRFHDTVAGAAAMQRAVWVPGDFLHHPSIVQVLEGSFFAVGASSGGALLQVYVISADRIIDPFEDPNCLPDADTGSNKKARCDPRMRMVPPARPPHPQPDPSSRPDFYVQGVRWRYAADVEDLHRLVDTASAAFRHQYTMLAYLQSTTTNWVVRIAPAHAAAADGGGDGKAEGAAGPISGWTCQQLRGESAPPSGALTLGYHQQPKSRTTRPPGAAAMDDARRDYRGIETIVTCLRARVAPETPKHVPVRDSLSAMTYSDAFRRRAPLVVIPVFPDRFILPVDRRTRNAAGDEGANTLKVLQDAARLAAMCAPEGGRGPFADVT